MSDSVHNTLRHILSAGFRLSYRGLFTVKF